MNEDLRIEVVRAVRESLPEFCRRNRVLLSEREMDNLAQWVTSTIPPKMYKLGCHGMPCACTGYCQTWYQVPDDNRLLMEPTIVVPPEEVEALREASEIAGGRYSLIRKRLHSLLERITESHKQDRS